METDLADTLLASVEAELRESTPSSSRAELDLALREILENCKKTWPRLNASQLDPGEFCRHVGASLDGDSSVADQLKQLHGSDLYLAWACSKGDARAISEFESNFGNDIDRAVLKVGNTSHGREDLAQRVREKLFVADKTRPARISAYSGRGSLRSWVRVTGIRCVLDIVRWKDDSKRRVSLEDGMLERLPGDAPDPELDYLRQAHAERLPAAMRRAFDSLTPRQRNLLRHRFLHGLSTEKISRVYGVHRATLFRWLETARLLLVERTREFIQQELDLSGRELESLIAALRSRIDISVGRLLSSSLEQEDDA